jgi:hypothetical protein
MRYVLQGFRQRWFVLGSAFLLALLITTVKAQISNVSASLEGTISDSAGAVISGAQVRLRNTGNNQTRTITTDDQGLFRANELPVGTYEIRVDQPGFAPYLHAGVTLSVGQSLRFSIELVPAALAEAVTVSDQPQAIDPSQTSVTSTIDTERIEELPVLSRNYLNFVLLAPGVAPSTERGTSNTQTQLADSGFAFGGLRARSNNLSIDGLDNNDEYTGASRAELSLEIVREFQVVNNGISAEFGGASGGSINVVTKTGANQIHGDAFLFLQNGALNAREPLSNEPGKGDLNRYRTGLSLGGPLIKDRMFYYAGFEQEHNRSQSSSDIDQHLASAINQFLAMGAYPRLATRSIITGFFPVSRAETEASAKLNHQLNPQHSLMIRYALTNNRAAGDAFNTGGLTDASSRGSSFTKDHVLVGSLVSLFGTSVVGNLRFQLATRRVALRTNDEAGPEIDINGIINFGRPYEGNDHRRENHYEASYTLSVARRAHLLKAGFTANHVALHSVAPDGFGAIYNFGSVADFFAGRADSFRQAFGNATTDFGVTSYGGFLQDHWSPVKRLTVDLGLRYDFEHLPEAFNQDTNNLSPRIGLAYSPSDTWVVRAGYGVFYDRYVLAFLNRGIEKNGASALEQVVSDAAAASAIFRAAGGGPGPPLGPIRPSIFRGDPGLATPYSQQANLGIEHSLTKNLVLGANYLFVRGVKLPRTRNVNLLAPVALTTGNAAELGVVRPTPQQLGRAVFGPNRKDSDFNDIYEQEDSGASTYHGLSVVLNRRLSNDFELSASYTISKTIDDASDFDEEPQNPLSNAGERALSRMDQRQRFVLSALYDLPFGEEEEKAGKPQPQRGGSGILGDIFGHIEVAPIMTIGSGRPMNPLTGVDSTRNAAYPLSSRPLGFGRNTLRTPVFATIDLRAIKYVLIGEHGKLDFVVEAFNLFNRTNVSQINPFYGSGLSPRASFGLPIEAFNARHIQISIDLEF